MRNVEDAPCLPLWCLRSLFHLIHISIMNIKPSVFKFFFFLLFISTPELQAQLNAEDPKLYQDLKLEIIGDYRYYFKEGAYEGQQQHYPSIALQQDYYVEWEEGKQSVRFTTFFRLDKDRQRTHFDVRELYWQWVKRDWELSVGMKKIFWGVTESAHLVDIINQTDQVESFDGEAKLGQPMVHFSYLTNIGVLDFFVLPYFRERQFPGEKGRLRPPFLLSDEDFRYESSAKRWHPDVAVRWSNSFGIFDMGLSYFYGTGREPVFLPDAENAGFDLVYPINHQLGLDLQATTGPVLWKLESMWRENDLQDPIFALAGGLEYTFGNINGRGLDIGLVAEYLYDSRDELALNGQDNDLFAGMRIALNDVQSTSLLLGGIFDLNKSSRLLSVEASRRIGNSWKVELEARILDNIAATEFLALFRDDSFAQFRLIKYF